MRLTITLLFAVVFSLLQAQPTAPAVYNGWPANYTFTSWSDASTAGTYPANMAFWRTSTNDPSLLSTPNADYTGAYNGTTGTRMNGTNANGFSWTNTGTAGNLGMAVVGLNTTGRTDIQVSWTGRMLSALTYNATSQNRDYRIRLQYYVGSNPAGGTWTDVPGPIEFTSFATATSYKANGASQTFGPTTLPSACNNQAQVYVRWFYYNTGSSGTRPTLGLDEITISSTASTTPTLGWSPTSLTGFTATQGTPSSPSSATLTGSSLTGNVTVTAPTGLQVQDPATSNWVNSFILTPSGGAISQSVPVRVAASASTGSFSLNVQASGGGVASPVNLAVSGQVNGNFTAGNLLVIRANGTGSNTTASVLELLPNIAGQTTPIQTVDIPGSGSGAIRVSGSATSSLYASQSNDGTLFTLTGHNNTNTGSNANTLNPRAVVTIDNTGAVNIAATYTGTSGNQTRSATSLDNSNWAIADNAGLYTNSATSFNPAGNYRKIRAFGGKFYVGRQTTIPTEGIVSEYTSIGGSVVPLPGVGNSNTFQDFYLIRSSPTGCDYDVLYIVENTTATAGTIRKFSLVSGNWVSNGTYTNNTYGGFGLAAENNGSGGAYLYVTTGNGATSGNSVRRLTDAAGYNTSINITSDVVLYSAPAGTILKGVDFTPKSATAAPLATISVSPGAVQESTAGTVTITVNTPVAVTGNQTINYEISGFNITASDFAGGTLTGTVTILNGQTSGFATVQVVNDAFIEGNEIAAVKITGATSGVTVDLCDAGVNFTIEDDDFTTVYSQGSGNAFNDAIWDVVPSGTGRPINLVMGSLRFNGTKNVVIQNGHTVDWIASDSVLNLTVESGAMLRRGTDGAVQFIRVFGNTITVDGQLGDPSTPNYDAIGLDLSAANTTISGVGEYNIAQMRNLLCPSACNVDIQTTMNFKFTGTAIYAEQNNAVFNINIPNGVTVHVNGDVALDGSDGLSSNERGVTINVDGILNVTDIFYARANNSVQPAQLTIGSDAVVRVGHFSFNNNVSGSAQNFQLNIIPGGRLQIDTALNLLGGTFVSTAAVELKSESNTHAAIIDNFSPGHNGAFTGVITFERYHSTTSGLTFERHRFSTPVANMPLARWNANGNLGYLLNTNCNDTLSDQGTPYGNVMVYDENAPGAPACGLQGWRVVKTGNVEPARGYSVRRSNPGTFIVTGAPNFGANYTRNNLTNSNWSNTTLLGIPQASGWHLIGNPYPTYLNLTSHGVNFDMDVYVWITEGPLAGTYQNYTPGTNAIIPPFGVFAVRRSSIDLTGADYTVKGADRSKAINPDSYPFYKANAESALHITVTNSANGLIDNVVVGFDNQAEAAFNPQMDALKLYGLRTRHTLYTTAGTEKLARNVLHSISETPTVPMGFYPGVNGTYTISFENVHSFDPTSYIYLEDKVTGMMHNVRNGAYTFMATSTQAEDRFVLHFTPAVEITSSVATCTTDGQITIEQSGTAEWNYTIENAQAVLVSQGNLNETAPATVIVPAGVYTLSLVDANGYTVVKNILVEGAIPMHLAMSASNAITEVDAMVEFTATANTNTTNYEWNLGNGTVLSTVTPVIEYTYTAEGIYNVEVSAVNEFGCSATALQQVVVTPRAVTGIQTLSENDIKVWNDANRVFVSVNGSNAIQKLEVFNILGQQIINANVNNQSNFTLEIPNTSTGVVLIKAETTNGVAVRKLIIE